MSYSPNVPNKVIPKEKVGRSFDQTEFDMYYRNTQFESLREPKDSENCALFEMLVSFSHSILY